MGVAKPPRPQLQRGHPLALGVIADWPTYEGSGTTLNDISGSGYTGAFISTPTWVAGQSGWALSFNGSTAAVSTPLKNLNYNEGTICWSAKPTEAYNSGTRRPMWGQLTGGNTNPSLSAQVYTDNNFYVGWFGASDRRVTFAATATNYPQGIWSRYVFTWSTTAGSAMYQNTRLIGSNASAATPSNVNDNFLLAGLGSGYGFFWSGTEGDFRIYSRRLSAAEIQLDYLGLFNEYRPQRRPWLGTHAAGIARGLFRPPRPLNGLGGGGQFFKNPLG